MCDMRGFNFTKYYRFTLMFTKLTIKSKQRVTRYVCRLCETLTWIFQKLIYVYKLCKFEYLGLNPTAGRIVLLTVLMINKYMFFENLPPYLKKCNPRVCKISRILEYLYKKNLQFIKRYSHKFLNYYGFII